MGLKLGNWVNPCGSGIVLYLQGGGGYANLTRVIKWHRTQYTDAHSNDSK